MRASFTHVVVKVDKYPSSLLRLVATPRASPITPWLFAGGRTWIPYSISPMNRTVIRKRMIRDGSLNIHGFQFLTAAELIGCKSPDTFYVSVTTL